MKYFKWIVLFFLLLAGRMAVAQSSQNVIADLNKLFSYLHKEKMFNGAVGVRYKGKTIFEHGYGTGNFETRSAFTPASQTELASVSKQFTATAIMLLWKDGKLRLNDNINAYFDPKLPYEGITIKDLLTHQSGLPRYTPFFKKGWDPQKVATNEDIVRLLRKYHPPVFFSPGSHYRYSNLGYILLAQIVKKVSGERLDHFLTRHVFVPFGMSATGFYPRFAIFRMPLYAPGMIWSKDSGKYVRPEYFGNRKYVWYLSGRFGSGRLTSSVNDLLTWDSLLYTNSILPQAIIRKMFVPQVSIPGESASYGFGWKIDSADHSIVFHKGSWPGNYTYIKRFTRERSTVVILNNTYSKYMKAIRNTTDAIVKGEPWHYPEKKE